MTATDRPSARSRMPAGRAGRKAEGVRPDTLAVHAGREDFARLCVHAPPLDLSSTYPLGDLAGAAEAFDALSRGEASDGGSPVYQRLQNPTVRRYERALAALEHTEDAVAFASGMAALTAVLLAACGERRHVVAIRPLYGGSDHLLACGLLGLDVTWAAPGEIAISGPAGHRPRRARDAAEPHARDGRHPLGGGGRRRRAGARGQHLRHARSCRTLQTPAQPSCSTAPRSTSAATATSSAASSRRPRTGRGVCGRCAS